MWAAMAAALAVLAARARRIAAAEHQIRDSLQDNLFNDVGHTDLTTIAQTLSELPAGEASAVVASLSDRELAVWMRELDGWAGRFSETEEEALFAMLAGSISASQLARLASSGKSGEVMAAVARGAPSPVRAETALALWSQFDPADRAWGDIIQLFLAATVADQEAATSGAVPGSLLVDLLGVHVRNSDGAPRIDLTSLVGFLDTAAHFTDPGLKAELFVAGQTALEGATRLHVTGAAEPSAVSGRLGSLVRSDPAGVMVHLSHDVDPHGDVFSAWVGDMIDADRLDELDVLLAGLLGGPDRLEHFTDPGDHEARPYPNAANLGYYVGSYSLAIDAVADGAEDQIAVVKTLFSIVTGVVPGPDNSWIKLPVGPLVDTHARSVVDGLRSQATSLKQTLWGLAKPRSPDGLLWNGAGTTQFQDAWEEVVAVR